MEGHSYSEDLKRFRPHITIQSFIDLRNKNGGRLTPDMDAKRKAVVRDWFRLSLWFVRLRRAAKGKTPTSLIRVEERLQRKQFFNGIMRIRQARI